MRLSPEKVLHLSKSLLVALQDAEETHDSLRLVATDDQLKLRIRETLSAFLAREEAIVEKVRAKIASIRRGVPEGSAEWDAMFRQFYNEEMDKLRRIK